MQCVLKQGSNGGVKQFDTGISAFDRNRGWGGVKKDLLDRGQKLKIVKSLPGAHGAGHQKSFIFVVTIFLTPIFGTFFYPYLGGLLLKHV